MFGPAWKSLFHTVAWTCRHALVSCFKSQSWAAKYAWLFEKRNLSRKVRNISEIREKTKRYSKESGYRNDMSRALKPNVRRIRTTIFCSLDSTM